MRNIRGHYLVVGIICIVLAACNQQPEIAPDEKKPSSTFKPPPLASETPFAPTATARATSQATRRITPTRTPAPALVTEQPPSTLSPSPTPEATPAVLALEGPAISYNGISFNVDLVLGNTVYAHDEQLQSSSGAMINYTRFTFEPEGWCREVGCVEVYPVAQYQEAFPGRPLPPLGAATILRAQDQPLGFQNGDGARSIRMRGQDIFFANNEALVYDYQGFSDDGQYYVSIIMPIDAPILLSAADPNENKNAAAIPVPAELPSEYDQLGTIIQEYNQEAESQLDLLAAADFTPSLSVLDALVASLRAASPMLESEIDAADSLAVCPPPNEEQPPTPKVTEDKSIVDMFEPQILDYLNAGGDAQELQAALSRLTLTDSSGTDWQAKTQVFTTDLTGDTTPEVVADLSFFVEGQYADGAIFVFHCQAGGYAGGAVRRIGGQVFSADDPDPGIRAIQDMNSNGKNEIVFSYITVIGTHANFTREFRIIEWDGSQFVDLIQGGRNRPYAAEVLNGDGVIRDSDGDGLLELELTHGVGHGSDTSTLDSPRAEVWAWDGEAFTLAYTEITTTLGTRQVTVFHVTTPLPTPTPATATLNPEIIEFVVSPLKVHHGDPITLTWKVTAEQASISYLNNAGRLSAPLSVPFTGGLVFTTSLEPRDDYNLAFYLSANSGDASTQAEIEIEFLCPNNWFFPNPPESCPLPPTHHPSMMAQRFEHGVMFQNEAYEGRILVLRQNGNMSYADNAWSPGVPEYDPNIIPPSAYYQPVRSFGMVWREHPEIREQLGWAIDEEFALDGMVQCDTHSKYPKCYMTGLDNQIYVLEMFSMTWFVWPGQ